MTRTFATMEVPKEFYDGVKAKMIEAGYNAQVHEMPPGEGDGYIDMHGIALVAEPQEEVLKEGSVQKAHKEQHGS